MKMRRRLGVAASCIMLALTACGGDENAEPSADTGAAAPAIVTDDQRDALSAVAQDYAQQLAELQQTGAAALAPGGSPATFYSEFAKATKSAAEQYSALSVPAEIEQTRGRLTALLDEQGQLLEEIAAGAEAGDDASVEPQLERLTEVLGDITTVNAEFFRSMGIEPPDPGT